MTGKIAMLDELEEWQLLLSHYCVLLAVSDDTSAPIFGSIALDKPVGAPPLASLPSVDREGSAGEGGGGEAEGGETGAGPADVEGREAVIGSTGRVMGSMLNAQHAVPLGGPVMEEEENEEENEEGNEGAAVQAKVEEAPAPVTAMGVQAASEAPLDLA